MRTATYLRWGQDRAAVGWLLAVVLLAPSVARCQTPDAAPAAGPEPRDFGLGSALFANPSPVPSTNPQHIRLFRIAPGFISDPPGLQDSDTALPGTPSLTPSLPPDPDTGPDWIQVAMGSDNPYFDFRKRGDPGGLGFYRVNTQLQVVDTTSTACSVGLQAVMPAGIQYNGVPDGPTVFSPHFSLFQALDDDTAVQCFVGKHLLVNSTGPSAATIRRDLQYGMAVQRSLACLGAESLRNVYFFMGALGQYRAERNESAGAAAVWEMLPGMHWQLTENWWLSGGVLLPVGPTRADNAVSLPWQLTCSFQF
jgi:hypothetical protein